jgi:hypothetical protein
MQTKNGARRDLCVEGQEWFRQTQQCYPEETEASGLWLHQSIRHTSRPSSGRAPSERAFYVWSGSLARLVLALIVSRQKRACFPSN